MNEQPQPGSPERVQAIKDHIARVIKIYLRHHPDRSIPPALRRLSEFRDPECRCTHPLPQHRFGTFICSSCGGIAIPDKPISLDAFPRDVLGNKPAALRGGKPIACPTCERAYPARLVYLRFDTGSKKLWCPRCTGSDKHKSFTSRLLHRKRAQA